MCGIAGLLGTWPLTVLDAMAAGIRHRGPDGQGTWCNEADRIGMSDTSNAEGVMIACSVASDDGSKEYGILWNPEVMTDAVTWHSRIARDFDDKYASSPAFRERLGVWSELIQTFSHPQAAVLDVGCGSGVLSLVAARHAHSVVGFDGSLEMIAIAEAKRRESGLDNASFHVQTLEEMQRPGSLTSQRKFDLILCSSVLEYLEDYWRSVDAMNSLLKDTGVLVLSMPNGSSLYRKCERAMFRLCGWPPYYAHVRHVPRPADLTAGLAARRLEIVAHRYYAGIPGLSTLARRLGRPDLSDNLFVIACRPRK